MKLTVHSVMSKLTHAKLRNFKLMLHYLLGNLSLQMTQQRHYVVFITTQCNGCNIVIGTHSTCRSVPSNTDTV